MSIFQSKKHAENCPECGASLQMKRSKQGLFLGCSAYPSCDYLKPLHNATHIIKNLDEHCPECHNPLQLKQGNYGMFIGCSNYPDCDFTVHDETEEIECFCPQCDENKLVARQGRSGKTFYGCAGYPQCRFTLFSKPIQKECPLCHSHIVTAKKVRGKKVYTCIMPSCQHSFIEEE
ncbi:DNA topoisomerase 1 [Phocoenobacter uteri]|uniref:DNA topoisomerase 1 n=1 Tax=Phocoenobacter uteri TaxID=146806 RepID=A0A379CAK2_9PAST|nr:topoisomerase DNA-binding C4 zinc finger domain-containing protein [Phocoenobacter uteri]MDG6881167.1 hypothetical protein [Phocoenobacter uteri]SUB59189.1 DNA topoisomerase 1 [Phocoenobacter uteri]